MNELTLSVPVGTGVKVERIYREVRVMCIGGGSVEIMKELSLKLARL